MLGYVGEARRRLLVDFGREGHFDEVVAANASPGLVMMGGPLARIDRKHLLPGGCRDPPTLDFLDGDERSTAAAWERQ
jgi:hypothetical protein